MNWLFAPLVNVLKYLACRVFSNCGSLSANDTVTDAWERAHRSRCC